jgi:hypothetical protein
MDSEPAEQGASVKAGYSKAAIILGTVLGSAVIFFVLPGLPFFRAPIHYVMLWSVVMSGIVAVLVLAARDSRPRPKTIGVCIGLLFSLAAWLAMLETAQ